MEIVILALIVGWITLHSYNHYRKEKLFIEDISELKERLSSIE